MQGFDADLQPPVEVGELVVVVIALQQVGEELFQDSPFAGPGLDERGRFCDEQAMA